MSNIYLYIFKQKELTIKKIYYLWIMAHRLHQHPEEGVDWIEGDNVNFSP